MTAGSGVQEGERVDDDLVLRMERRPPLLTAATWAEWEAYAAGRSQPGRGRFAVAATPIGGRAVIGPG
jgi:hypothetical protein